MTDSSLSSMLDIAIIGAGISGINAAYRIQTQLPDASYTILEGRDAIGGTWDFFRYPGIRSDSDLHTFGFQWRPWMEEKAIADGASIRKYIRESAALYGIDRKVQFRHKVLSVNWSSDQQAWILTVDANGERKIVYSRFIFLGTGYYDYNDALQSVIPGIDNFKGKVVHPQFWPEGLDYKEKKVTVIGSGATAITLVPAMSDASHVTMIQRSPSYYLSLPSVDGLDTLARRILPAWMASYVNRLKNLIIPVLLLKYCQNFPNASRRTFINATMKQLPKTVPEKPHFTPRYNPWEQRLCLMPDGDFFKALSSGHASIVTGKIDTVTATGIKMESGETIDADIIVTATGLKIQIGGGMQLNVDGQPFEPADKFVWKSLMIQDAPNFAICFGYAQFSWTLGADTAAHHFVRLYKYMQSKGYTSTTPRLRDPEKVGPLPILPLKSTYVEKGSVALPKCGDVAPWRPRGTFFSDMWEARFGDLKQGLEFAKLAT